MSIFSENFYTALYDSVMDIVNADFGMLEEIVYQENPVVVECDVDGKHVVLKASFNSGYDPYQCCVLATDINYLYDVKVTENGSVVDGFSKEAFLFS